MVASSSTSRRLITVPMTPLCQFDHPSYHSHHMHRASSSLLWQPIGIQGVELICGIS